MNNPANENPNKLLGYGVEVPVSPQNIEMAWQDRNTRKSRQNPVQVVTAGKQPHTDPYLPENYVADHQKRKNITWGAAIGLTIFILTILGLSTRIGGSILFFLALIPLIIVIRATVWVGNWNPKPGFIRILAFLWGAVGSIFLTLGITNLWGMVAPEFNTDPFLSATFQAPIVEELTKGVFVLTIALFFRKYFNTTIDGIVYAMLVAAGFAFTENILYFIQSISFGGLAGLTMTFFLRGILSPFAHAMFTLPMGLLVGYGIKTHKTRLGIIGLFTVGYVVAITLHGLWNGASGTLTNTMVWLMFYAIIQIPLFVVSVIVITVVKKQEMNRTWKVLVEYTNMGVFSRVETETFGTKKGRKYLHKWAKKHSPNALFLVKNLTQELADLTLAREAVIFDDARPGVIEREQQLLAKVVHDKNLLAAMN